MSEFIPVVRIACQFQSCGIAALRGGIHRFYISPDGIGIITVLGTDNRFRLAFDILYCLRSIGITLCRFLSRKILHTCAIAQHCIILFGVAVIRFNIFQCTSQVHKRLSAVDGSTRCGYTRQCNKDQSGCHDYKDNTDYYRNRQGKTSFAVLRTSSYHRSKTLLSVPKSKGTEYNCCIILRGNFISFCPFIRNFYQIKCFKGIHKIL